MKSWLGIWLCALLLTGCAGGDNSVNSGSPKVIIDSDYNTLSDDGQLGVMAAQLMAQGSIDIKGITVVSGNQWLMQETADALKSVERLGVENKIGIYAGANYALSHDQSTVERELKMYPGGDGYLGAWTSPEPKSQSDLIPPPDGFAVHTSVQPQSAVDFIVKTVKENPGQITILAIGPLTNIATATTQHPEIVPLIKQIIYMGGAFDVPGNSRPAAEFNWWFDPDAAKMVLRLPIRHIIVPLDVTNTVTMNETIYKRIAHDPAKQTIITKLFEQLNGYGFDGKNGFETNPNYTTNIWDTLTIAYLMDPSLATHSVQRWVDVNAEFGPSTGQSVSYTTPQPGLQQATIIKGFDNDRFFNMYVDLLTRPVPVVLHP